MSTTIDEKVVEMRFDNKHFESNVKKTMSTLDKFKQKLNLSGASKSLENINTAANKINMSGMSNAIGSVTAKFSALEVMGVTALANITNSAVNAGKRIAKSLTIEPISDGWKEYEMTLNAVQTTMAGTGKTAEEVEKELKKLDVYADKTVYSTADMLSNLPKFTNAGVELEKATTAMIGIANATALAGGDAGKASIAFYNLGQAIGTGYLTRMDYNSINNAGIATMEWKEQMVEAAIAAGTLQKVGENSYKAGKKTMTLQQLFIDGLQEQWATTEVMMKVFGDYGDETTEIGKKSYSAAQDIKTFTMMMDSLKATAGTGWKDTWQTIFGGLDEAKEFWTGLTNFISNIITGMADFRNKLLEGALGKSFSSLSDKVKNIVKPIQKSADSIKDVVKSVDDYAKVVDEIIGGKWDNGQKRWDALTEAGYDWAHAQNLVNEKLGNAKRHATNYTKAQKELSKSQNKVSKTTSKQIAELAELSETELRVKGYTEEQVKAFKDLAEAADKTGIPLQEFIENIDEIDGRYLLINTFKNLGESLVRIFKSVGEAWTNAFPPMSSDQLFDVITGLHKFSTIIREHVEKNADSLTRTLKGLFAIIDIIATFVGGGFKLAFTILKTVLGVFNLSILDFTALVGDAIVKVRDWIEEHNLLAKAIEFIVPYISAAVQATKDWITNNELITKTINNFKSGLDNLSKKYDNWIKSIGGKQNIAKYLIQGLANGLADGATYVVNGIINLGKKLWAAFCDFFGIHSPSTKFYEAGTNIIDGLINGIRDGGSKVLKAIKETFGSIDQINWSGMASMLSFVQMIIPGFQRSLGITTAFARWMGSIGIDSVEGLIVGIGTGASKVVNAILNIGKAMFEAFCEFFGIKSPSRVFIALGGFLISGLIIGLTNGESELSTTISNMGSKMLDGIKNFASKCVEYIKKIDWGKLLAAGIGVGIIVVVKQLTDVLKIFSAPLTGLGNMFTNVGNAIKSFGDGVEAYLKGKAWKDKSVAIKNIAIAIALMAGSIFLLTKVETPKLWSTIGAIAALVVLLGGLAFAASKMSKLGDFNLSSKAILSIAASLLIVAMVLKTLGSMDGNQMETAVFGLIGMVGAISLLMLAVGKCVKGTDVGKIHKVGSMIKKIASALLLMVLVIKLASMLEYDEIFKGIGVIAALGLLIKGIITISNMSGEHAAKAGSMIGKIAIALLITIGVIKLASMLEAGEILKGIGVIAALGILFAGLVAISNLAGENANKAGTMLLMMSVALAIVVGVIKQIADLTMDEIGKGILVISALGVFFSALIAVSYFAGEHAAKAGTMLLFMSGALLILTGVIFLLSKMNPDGLGRALGIVSVLELLFMGLIYVSKNAKDSMGSLIAITIAIAILIGALIGLSFIDSDKLMTTAGSISAVMIAFGILLRSLKSSNAKVSDLMKPLLPLITAVALLGVIIALMSHYIKDPESAIGSAIAISILVTALSLVMKSFKPMTSSFKSIGKSVGALALIGLVVGELGVILGLLNKYDFHASISDVLSLSAMLIVMTGVLAALTAIGLMAPMSYAGIGALAVLSLVVGEIGLILGLLNKYDLHASISDVGALSAMLIVMTGVLAALGAIGLLVPMSFAGIGALAVLGLVVGEIGLILGLLNKYDLHASMTDVEAISKMLLSMSGALVLLGLVGMLGPSAFIGIGALETLILALGGTLVALGAIQEHVFDLEKFIDKGMPILEKIAESLGSFFGHIVGGFAKGVTSGLPETAQNLTDFMNKLTEGFIPGAKTINQDVVNGIKNLADAMWTLTKADFIDNLTFGSSSLTDFGKDLSKFGEYLMKYSNSVKDVDQDAVLASSTAAKNLAEAAKAASEDGLLGTDGIDDFGRNVVHFGASLKTYSDTVTGLDGTAITNSVAPAKALLELGKEVSNIDDGWIGTDGIDDFGYNVAVFGSKLKEYSNLVTGLDGTAITNSIAPAKSLMDLGKEVATVKDGWLGTDGIDDFGKNIADFGAGLKSYSDSVKDYDATSVTNSISASKELIGLGKEVSGVDDGVFGKSGIDNFGKDIKKFGKKLAGYSEEVSGLDITSIDNSVNATKKIIELIKSTSGIDTNSINTFADALKKLGKVNIDGFISAFNESTGKITDTATHFIDTFIKAISSKVESFKNAGKVSLSNFLVGILDGHQSKILTATTTIIGTAITAINANYNSFYTAGGYLCQGLTNGLKDPIKRQAVYDAAYSLGKLAVKGEKDGQQSNSPSKATEQAGKWLGEGLVIGIKQMGTKVYNAGRSMGEEATNSISNALDTALNLLNSDMDTQPTIRPVLDLSDVESGMGYLGGMFNNGPSLAVATNLGAISSGMNTRNQNGVNNDVVSAINNLRKDLSNVGGGDTYNIDGITYDDGSNITDAVKSIVRAAKVGRRT